ncbi:E3 SUMO-protein ligase nse2 [Tolypocladium ophioglossoides CBS 100239]|uniref:E3 SUMO-protein ligase nse2 n=1 Tax=Tolypocladium ophioglossoides (strain CBS 100239) TaxID=1163406 RepID=A0A0L0N9C3_TOLOC|nr:E3 SUMO-protein ligase nse2 [Tolypocladium ophioglossoides CBS 100239]
MPRLVNRGNAATALASLPEYQPPAWPLNDIARRSLGELPHRRGTVIYGSQLKESVRFLGLGVGDLHERLRAQQERLEAQRDRRQERGIDKTAEEERLEAYLEQLEDEVDGLTHECEEAVRDIIDKRAELEDEAVVLRDLYTAAATTHNKTAAAAQRSALNVEDQGEADDQGEFDDQKEDPVPSTADAFRERRAQKLADYTNLNPHQRYALNNDYAGFKKIWHDAAAGGSGPPLPDASRWFRSNGQPVMDRPGAEQRRHTAGGDDDDDDDIAVAREVLSLNCPLTLRPMEEPYSNNKCKHTFEKSAILHYLSRQGQMQCPQTGCSQTFSRAKFADDFYLDQAILRRIQRAQESQRNDEMEEDEDEDDDDEESMVVQGGRRVRGRAPKQEADG